MIFTFDVGNTETTAALFDGDEIRASWRLTTNIAHTPDEYALLLFSLLREQALERDAVSGTALCSVVPGVTRTLETALERCFGAAPIVIDARSKLPVRLEVDEPLTVGADRVANTLAASRIYRRDSIVVDLGTATTYDCITADGAFIGGVIQPGVGTSADTLFRRTAQLAATELVPPQKVIGTRTDECIRAGVLYGSAESIDGLVRRIKSEWQVANPLVLATGGLARILRPFCREIEAEDPFLTLRGVLIGYQLLSPQRPA